MRRQTLTATGAFAAIWLAGHATGQGVDTSDWTCDGCPFPEPGWRGDVDVGALYVSDDNVNFGDYRGLDEEGVYASLDGHWHYRGERATGWELRLDDLGLDSRSLTLDGGQQGLYRLTLGYDELVHYRYGDALTPFTTSGGRLMLPSGWTSTGSSRTLPGLGNALGGVVLGTERDTLALALQFTPRGPLRYEVGYRRQEKNGTGLRSGSSIARFVQLPSPIDHVTDEIDVTLTVKGEAGHASLAYYGSWFSNRNTTLTWDEPFTPLAAGADRGRLALAPDNQAHRLSLSGTLRAGPRTRLSATAAAGRLSQNDALTAYTINNSLAAGPLPFASLDAEVDTTRLHVRALHSPTKRLRLLLDLDMDERDNGTPVAEWNVVRSDLFPDSDPRNNRPYSFERRRARAEASLRLADGARIAGGYGHRRIERDLQEVARTTEDSLWLRIRAPRNLPFGAGAGFFVSSAERDGSDYLSPEALGSGQNPLLRKYNLADRDRDMVEFDLPLVNGNRGDFALRFSAAEDEYGGSVIGLQSSERIAVTGDAGVRLSERFFLTASHAYERYETRQAGSEAFAAPDWQATTDDTINTSTLGLSWRDVDGRVQAGLDFARASSESEIALSAAATEVSRFPDLETRLDTATLWLSYALGERLSLRASVLYEHFDGDDWMLDGVGVTRLPAALLTGIDTPDYDVTVLGLSFTWRPAD